MKTYYFGAVAASGKHISQSFYSVEASHYDAAERAVILETEWIWGASSHSFQLFELPPFLFNRLKRRYQVDGIVVVSKVVA